MASSLGSPYLLGCNVGSLFGQARITDVCADTWDDCDNGDDHDLDDLHDRILAARRNTTLDLNRHTH